MEMIVEMPETRLNEIDAEDFFESYKEFYRK